ncbi:O-antigen translocase [Aureitalea marina]|uniref:O-antigen translocase n=1 Tax=Aureitalea marina TaxID=930804 RepID=A0A2S7KQG5_9FLAO|nr:O-antigen translocase [Aureitalea marina]PQB04847.1 hypothetical protein BST85_08030 [Aureitalea marina]
MSDSQKEYRQILKATSLFGGVQVFNILIAIVRSKVIAWLIGPAGMGIASLLNSTLNLVNGATNLGLDRSAVKEIAFAENSDNEQKSERLIAILNRLVWITSLVGALLMTVFSGPLSQWAFGDTSYDWAFMWLSLALIFKQLTASRLAVLQGLRKLGNLAKANLIGNGVALVLTLPLYYYYGIVGIVPAIILTALISLIVVMIYSQGISRSKDKIGRKDLITEGKSMVNLGVMMSLSSMITLVVGYLIQIYISGTGGLDEVGLYNAGFVILNTYVGLIFSAMATDYFPRLSGVAEDPAKVSSSVLQQAVVANLLITPIVVLFIGVAPWMVRILYTAEFLPVVPLLVWGILGMVFKASSWSVGYIILAKGDSRLFIRTSIFFNSLMLTLNILGYRYGGLEGLGISFLIYYIIHFLGVTWITRWRYNFKLEGEFYPVFFGCLLLSGLGFATTLTSNLYLKYGGLIMIFLVASWFSWKQLNKRLDLGQFLLHIFKGRKKGDD